MFSSVGTEQAPAAEMPELDTERFTMWSIRGMHAHLRKSGVPDDVIARVVDAAQKPEFVQFAMLGALQSEGRSKESLHLKRVSDSMRLRRHPSCLCSWQA